MLVSHQIEMGFSPRQLLHARLVASVGCFVGHHHSENMDIMCVYINIRYTLEVNKGKVGW